MQPTATRFRWKVLFPETTQHLVQYRTRGDPPGVALRCSGRFLPESRRILGTAPTSSPDKGKANAGASPLQGQQPNRPTRSSTEPGGQHGDAASLQKNRSNNKRARNT